MTRSNYALSRRAFVSGAIGAGLLAGTFGRIRLSRGDSPKPEHRFIACFFNGGWDVLLGGDARDPANKSPGINLGTDLLPTRYRTPVPISIGGRETLIGAPMAALTQHADRLALFRGVNMNTVAHGTAKAYVNTYQQPAGVSERGSSLATAMASHSSTPDERILPNVAIGVPSFNTDYPPQYTGVGLQRPGEVLGLLRHESAVFPDEVEALLLRAQDATTSCVSDRYVAPRHSDQLKATRERVRKLLAENVAGHFDLGADTTEMVALRARYGFDAATFEANSRDPRVAAACTSQLIRTGLASAVTVQLQTGIDSHDNWADEHPQLLQAGTEALSTLLSDLREDDPDMSRTTVLVYSEFARTPQINGRLGRDHWFANSIFCFGNALKPGIYGATREDNLGLTKVDLASGLPSESGELMRPEHIASTLVSALKGDTSPYRVAPVSAWINGDRT